MVTLPSPTPPAQDAPHLHPEIAQGFGADAARYDQVRPRYPSALVDAVADGLRGEQILDVGIGTGISAEPFRERGFTLLGIEPDLQMAAVARAKGFVVERGRFEEWDPAGRRFDALISGQAWHWVDPVVGAAKAASVLRPDALLALFWNAAVPTPDMARAFAVVFDSLDTGLPFNPWAAAPHGEPYGAIIDRASDGLGQTGAFTPAERLAFAWQSTVGRDAWLEQASTAGGVNRLPKDQLAVLLRRMGDAIDEAGGTLAIDYTTVAAIAVRLPK